MNNLPFELKYLFIRKQKDGTFWINPSFFDFPHWYWLTNFTPKSIREFLKMHTSKPKIVKYEHTNAATNK